MQHLVTFIKGNKQMLCGAKASYRKDGTFWGSQVTCANCKAHPLWEQKGTDPVAL